MPTFLLILLLTLSRLFHAAPVEQQVMRSIVVLQFVDDDEKEAICTGFVISASAGEVLTARHCVPTSEEVTVDGLAATVLRKDDAFALLRIVPGLKPPLTLRTSRLRLGEHVQAYGYGWGRLIVLRRSVAMLWSGGDFGLDGPLAHGMSGGPVVDEKGLLVGLNQQSNDIMGIACGSAELEAFLYHPTPAPVAGK